jgi:hypothetical protein
MEKSNMIDEKPKFNIVDEFWKNSGKQEKYVISINHFQGNDFLDIRLFFKPDDKDNFFASRKGISLSVDHLNRLKAALEKATKRVQGG